jgi:hypothetical protein
MQIDLVSGEYDGDYRATRFAPQYRSDDTTLAVGGGLFEAITYLVFTLGIPKNAILSSGVLHMMGGSDNDTEVTFYIRGSLTNSSDASTTPTEDTIVEYVIISNHTHLEDNPVEFNIRSVLQSIVNHANYTESSKILLKLFTSDSHSLVFKSYDGPDESGRPHLVVEYTEPSEGGNDILDLELTEVIGVITNA